MTMPPWTFTHLPETPSTQDLAIAAARDGAHRHAFLAARQTAGRGRAGRAWHAPQGNLNFSAALRPTPQPLNPAAWSLTAGLALHAALTTHLPPEHHEKLRLKWPNDILYAGAKLGGILVDSSLTPSHLIEWIVIGIGVNLAHAPTLPDRPTASLAQHAGIILTPETLAKTLTSELDHWLAKPFPTIRQAWLARAHPPGTPLRVQTANALIQDRFDTIAEDGALLLTNGQRITSGDVFL
jgi:BirA family biotin operon repressor/biotin-[acetyl-CoA-carboxylase] ligase